MIAAGAKDPVGARSVEHDLPAEHELRKRWRTLDEIGEDRAVPFNRRAMRLRRLQMRCAHEHSHAVLPEALRSPVTLPLTGAG